MRQRKWLKLFEDYDMISYATQANPTLWKMHLVESDIVSYYCMQKVATGLTSVFHTLYVRHLGCHMLSLGIQDIDPHNLTLVIQDKTASGEWVLGARIIQIDIWNARKAVENTTLRLIMEHFWVITVLCVRC